MSATEFYTHKKQQAKLWYIVYCLTFTGIYFHLIFYCPFPPTCKYQLLVYADNVNILGRSVHIINEKLEDLVIDNKETGPEVNIEKLSKWACLEIIMQDEVTV